MISFAGYTLIQYTTFKQYDEMKFQQYVVVYVGNKS